MKLGIKIIVLLIGLLVLNYACSWWYATFDLTEDKRFTLSQPTKELLQTLDFPVHIRVLLEGDFPSEIKRLQNSTREILEDFKGVSKLVSFSFEDPNNAAPQIVNSRRKRLKRMGLNPFNLRQGKLGEKSEKLIFPGAIIEGIDTLAVNLLDNQIPGMDEAAVINNSISQLEYRLADAINKSRGNRRNVIAFTTGRGELAPVQTVDLEQSLRKNHLVGRLHMDSISIIDPQIDVLVVAKPKKKFSEKDKFVIDQFLMQGGRILWFIDRMAVDLDSMMQSPVFVPYDYPLNLEDILYKYGARILPNLVLDMDCTKIPLQTAMIGDAPQYDAFDWYYYPLVRPFSKNPIVKNLDRLQLKFASTIDTIRTKNNIKKTILLKTSDYSKMQYSPIELNFEILRYDPDKSQFNQPNQPIAVLLEGEFNSAYENRAKSVYIDLLKAKNLDFKKKSVPTQMLVVADGDIAANPIRKDRPLRLGQDELSGYIYANKEFLLNTIEYMLDDSGLINARNKEIKLRLLNRQKIAEEKKLWQVLNIAAPLILLSIFAFAYTFWRKRRYT